MKQIFRSNQKYTISTKAANLYLQAAGMTNGSSICLQNPSEQPDQLWQIKKAEDGLYQILSRSSTLCMDVADGGSEDGCWIHQWEGLGSSNQLWSLEEVEEGTYKIKNSGKCLDIVGMNAVAGAHLQLWTDVDGENQLWTIRPVLSKHTAAKKAK